MTLVFDEAFLLSMHSIIREKRSLQLSIPTESAMGGEELLSHLHNSTSAISWLLTKSVINFSNGFWHVKEDKKFHQNRTSPRVSARLFFRPRTRESVRKVNNSFWWRDGREVRCFVRYWVSSHPHLPRGASGAPSRSLLISRSVYSPRPVFLSVAIHANTHTALSSDRWNAACYILSDRKNKKKRRRRWHSVSTVYPVFVAPFVIFF